MLRDFFLTYFCIYAYLEMDISLVGMGLGFRVHERCEIPGGGGGGGGVLHGRFGNKGKNGWGGSGCVGAKLC